MDYNQKLKIRKYMNEKHDSEYMKLRKEYISKMTNKEKEDEMKDVLMYDYMMT